MKILDHISESVETIFWVKNTYSLMRIVLTLDPGSGMEKFGSGIQDKLPGFAILGIRFSVVSLRGYGCLMRSKGRWKEALILILCIPYLHIFCIHVTGHYRTYFLIL